MNRETWLQKGVALFRDGVFKQCEYKIPEIHVSIGWPYASRGTKRVGECWYPAHADDKKFHIHISPIHGKAFAALDTLVHELVHVVAGDAAHGPVFGRIARQVGLRGPMRYTPDMTAELKTEIERIIKILGPYPHGKLNPSEGRKKQTIRMFKMTCTECGYIARASRAYILYRGTLICPCNYQQMELDPTLLAALELEESAPSSGALSEQSP